MSSAGATVIGLAAAIRLPNTDIIEYRSYRPKRVNRFGVSDRRIATNNSIVPANSIDCSPREGLRHLNLTQVTLLREIRAGFLP
jgi:hypothetical protein